MASQSNEDLVFRFNQAADFLRTVAGTLEKEQLLQFYAYFKQSTSGRCNVAKPNWFDFEAKQKWNAWNQIGNISMTDAMKHYVSLVSQCFPDWDKASTMPKGWVSVSRLANCEDETPICNEDKTMFDFVKDDDLEVVKNITNAEVNIKDENGMCLIHWAADRGSSQMVSLLIDCGADINAQDNCGQTALHYACECGHTEIVKTLIDAGADGFIACDEGNTPADVALTDEITALVKHLNL